MEVNKMINIKRRKLWVLLLILTMSLTILSGCLQVKEEYRQTEEEQKNDVEAPKFKYPLDVEDGFGNKVVIEKEPVKIVSLAPSHTEILFALGLSQKIVGVSNYCDYPEAATAKEKVGDAMTVNVEKIIELEPDLVIQYGQGNEEVNKRIKDAGITILSYEPETVEEVIAVIEELGNITNTMKQATVVTVNMMSKMNYIVSTVEKAPKLKVFYEVWNEPLMAAGPGSFLDSLIDLAGGENIAKDASGKYPQFELEQLIERNPDVYLTAQDMPDKTTESIKNREGYETINAIKNDRIYILDPNIISRPGPRIVDGLEIVAKSIHPELFK